MDRGRNFTRMSINDIYKTQMNTNINNGNPIDQGLNTKGKKPTR